jgi:hypothetical protein
MGDAGRTPQGRHGNLAFAGRDRGAGEGGLVRYHCRRP